MASLLCHDTERTASDMFIAVLDYHHVVARLTQPVFHQVLEVVRVELLGSVTV